MRLEKGNPDNLEGKVLAYVYNLSKPIYVAIYGIVTPVNYSEFIEFLDKLIQIPKI